MTPSHINKEDSLTNVKITFKDILKDSGQSQHSTIFCMVFHTIVWPIVAFFAGGFFAIITLVFLLRGRLDEKPSKIFARVETGIISIIIGLLIFLSNVRLSDISFYRYGTIVSKEAYMVLSAILFLVGSFSLILLWRDYLQDVEIKKRVAETVRKKKTSLVA